MHLLLPVANSVVLPILSVVSTTVVIKALKERTPLYKQLSIFCLSILFYGLFYFLQFQCQFENSYINLANWFAVLCDFFRFLFLAVWVRLISMFFDTEPKINPAVFYLITFFYAFFYEILVIIIKTGPSDSVDIIVSSLLLKCYFIAIIFSYNIFVLVLAIYYLSVDFNPSLPRRRVKIAKVFNFGLIFYTLWICLEDCILFLCEMWKELVIQRTDPLLWIAAISSVVSIALYFKYDFLHLRGSLSFKEVEEIENRKSEELQIQHEQEIKMNIIDISGAYHLTAREAEVALLMYKGLSNPEIGNALFISENTVKRHINSIFKKAHVKSRYEFIALLHNHKIIS